MADDSFVAYLTEEALSDVANVTAKAMFGGHGLYTDGVIFGIVIDGSLYFKVGDSNRERYEAAGSAPFTYERGAKKVAMSYWNVPVDVVENKPALTEWAQEAASVARTRKK